MIGRDCLYAGCCDIVTDNYPKISELKFQLERLQNQSSANTPETAVRTPGDPRIGEINAIEAQLVELREVFTEKHPQVQELEARLKTLQK